MRSEWIDRERGRQKCNEMDKMCVCVCKREKRERERDGKRETDRMRQNKTNQSIY